MADNESAAFTEFLTGVMDGYMQTSTDQFTQQIFESLLRQYFMWWTFDHSPSPDEYMVHLSTRFCVSVDLQLSDASAAQAQGREMIQTCDVNVAELNSQFAFWAHQLKKLCDFGRRLGFLGNANDESLEAQEKTCRLMELLKDGRDSLVASILGMRKMDARALHDPLPPDYDTTTTLTKDIAIKNTNFQNLILFTLDLLRQQRYRKSGDFCFRELFTSGGTSMHAWEQVCTIKEFIYANITKERSYEQWKNLTEPRDNDRRIIENIKESEHPEFPQLRMKRTLFAFGNEEDGGLYSLEDDMFYPYSIKENWNEHAWEIHAHRQKFDSTCDLPAVPQREDVAIKYFDMGFTSAWVNNGLDSEDDNPMDLPTPAMDKILDDQQLTAETKFWVFALLGRLLYETGKLDNWQVLLFFKGIAGSGKSTIAKIMRGVYPPSMVASLSSNVEPRFGLAPLYDKLMVICAEVKKDFGMNQGDLQSAVSGEEVSVAIKNKDARTIEWKVPFLFCGNELAAWKDAAGSMKRRLIIIEFNEVVYPDPSLIDRIRHEFPVLLRKINLCYLHKAAKHQNTDLWQPGVLSPQMHEFSKNMREDVDVLQGFLNGPRFRKDPSLYILLDTIREGYKAFRREHGYHSEQWRKELYMNTFKELGFHVGESAQTLDYQGRDITGRFVFGIDEVPAEEVRIT